MEAQIKERKIDNRPMTQKLCKRFIEKKIIRPGITGSGLYINYKNNNEFCRLLKMYEHPKTHNYYFDVDVLEYDISMRISHTDITMIDGMSPNDFASASDIDENGKLLAITIMEESNLNESIVGQEYATLEGEELFDGMKITPMFDIDESLREQTLIVKGVGESISFKKNRGRPRTAYKNREAQIMDVSKEITTSMSVELDDINKTMMEMIVAGYSSGGKPAPSPYDQIKNFVDKIEKNPTLNDAWKEFNDIYKIIEGEEVTFYIGPDKGNEIEEYELDELDTDYVGI